MRDERLTRLQQELEKVPGVTRARVVGEEKPSEIHIVATSERAPKQIVRDTQSLATAGFGIPIDHRIVSIVQIDSNSPQAAPAPPPFVEETPVHSDGYRPVLERVVLASKGDAGWVKVALRWPDHQTTEGTGAAGASKETRARGAATALLQALEPALTRIRARVDVDHVVIHRIGSSDSVLVRAVFYERGAVTPVVGSALVYDDVATAAVRALLHAINRKLRSP
jgi:hypothetical protein